MHALTRPPAEFAPHPGSPIIRRNSTFTKYQSAWLRTGRRPSGLAQPRTGQGPDMARELNDVMAALPEDRQNSIEIRAMELATLKDLRISAQQSQVELAAAMGIGQDAISRLERRSDMLLSTLRHYVEGIGGELELVARFRNRPPIIIEQLAVKKLRRLKKPGHRVSEQGLVKP